MSYALLWFGAALVVAFLFLFVAWMVGEYKKRNFPEIQVKIFNYESVTEGEYKIWKRNGHPSFLYKGYRLVPVDAINMSYEEYSAIVNNPEKKEKLLKERKEFMNQPKTEEEKIFEEISNKTWGLGDKKE